MPFSNTFSIGFHNIEGMHIKNECKLNDIKGELSNDIEILAETWGCKCDLNFDNYIYDKVVPQKRIGIKKGRASGGFIVLVKNDISKKVNIIKKSNNFVWIEVDGELMNYLDGNVFIVGTYIHDITSVYYNDNIFEELSSDILKFTKENSPIMYIGDFNGRTGELDDNYKNSFQHDLYIPTPNLFPDCPKRKNCDKITNSHGKKIIDFCKTYDFKILNGRMKGDSIGNFTHLNANRGTSAIDYSLCNQYLYQSVENFIVLPSNEISDHSKVITIFKCTLPRVINMDKYKWKNIQNRYRWDDKNKKTFVNKLKDSREEIDDISQRIDAGLIESTGKKIQELYIKVAKKTLQKKSSKNWKKRKKTKKWFDGECVEMKKDLRGLGKEKHNKPTESILRTRYHEKLKEFKKKCRSKRNIFWEETLDEIENSLQDPTTFWKKWKNVNEIETSTPVPDITGEKWYNHFQNLHTEKNTEHTDLSHYNDGNQGGEGIHSGFTRKEFDTVIKNLKNAKSAGSDSISNEMLKNSPVIILDLLFRFVNICILKSLVPQSWCFELLNPIHKEGSKNDPNNYRGICISSALLKLLCCLINNRIQLKCTEGNLINKNQTGFKKNHRTSDNLLTLKNVVKKYVTIGKNKLYTCFVDFRKAYDSVWQKGLFYKMKQIGFSGNLLDLIRDMYKKTKCAVKMKDSITNYFDYTRGVRQGCPISPILFNIYVNDIFKIMNENNGSDIFLKEGEPINALMYADDLILISETETGLQNQLNKLSEYCKRWKLEVNTAKTKIMIFNRGNNLIKTKFKFNNCLENVKIMRYLGFTISANKCSFLQTTEDLSVKAGRAIYALNTKIKLSRIPTRLAIKIFNSQIKPILLYGAEVWGPYIDCDYEGWDNNKIEQTHTQYIKRCLGCNYQTSNIMARGEIGARPLLLDIIKKSISYINNIKGRMDSIAYSAYKFELTNEEVPNFHSYINKFNLSNQDIYTLTKKQVNNICLNDYDRRWCIKIRESPKAISYGIFKTTVFYEKYLSEIKNKKYKIALSRFRLSNHNLLIENGRHSRPRIARNERKCFLCKNIVEDEKHFITNCPLYSKQRLILYQYMGSNSIHFNSLETDEEKFTYIMTNENTIVMNELGKYISNAFLIRDKIILYFFT